MCHIKVLGRGGITEDNPMTLDGLTHRMIYSPHHHAEEGVAGSKELDFLGNEVLFLGLRFARNRCDNTARRSHL